MVGKTLTLTWKSKRKGKPRILQHGSKWKVTKVADSVLFSDKKGPWLSIESVKVKDGKPSDLRWIHQTDDPDFEIVQ